MRVSDFDYELPDRLIARYPARRRTDSRLLVFDRSTSAIVHSRFPDLEGFFRAGDTLVVNDSRVFKARLRGIKAGSGGQVELLCLNPIEARVWRVLCKPSRRIRRGCTVALDDLSEARVVEERQGGIRIVEFSRGPFDICNRLGELPLPPYLKRRPESSDIRRYQTVYSKEIGSVAAPTAGLHFSRGLLQRIGSLGVEIVEITLHVGWGTFKPVTANEAQNHRVESEWYSIGDRPADQLRHRHGRLFAIGTTTTRALESWWRDTSGRLEPTSGHTDLFIYPPYRFNLVDKLVTNFHLPKSSLLMLVSAFAGREEILKCYREAVRQEYRFYSYGDAMLIL